MIDELDENFAEYENAEIRRGMDLSELTADNFDKIERDDDGTAFGVTGGVPYPLATEIYQQTENGITYDFERRQDGSEWFLGKTGEKQRGVSVSAGNVAGEQPGMTPEGSTTRDVQRGLAQGAFDAGKNFNETLPMLGAPVDLVNEGIGYVGDVFGLDLRSDYPIGGSESIRDGVEALVGFADFLMPDAVQQADIAFRAEKPESPIIQEIVKGITEFGVNAVGPAMYLKAFTAIGPFARGLAWGGIADFINAQPDDRTAIASLTEFLTDATPEERSAIANATIDVFAQNGEDPDFINRAKVALDGMVIGGALEKGLELVVRASKQIPWSRLQEATVKAGARADERLASMAKGTTLSANPIGAAGDLALSAAGRVVAKKAELKMAPEGSRGHKVPHNLLVEGTGAKAITPVTQSFNQNNKAANFAAIDQLKQNHIDALKSPENWLKMEAEAFGGDFLPVPPMQAINYANDPAMMAEKLKRLSPEMKAGVDEGFANVQAIRSLYDSGAADEEMTANLFVWGILSRGAGPVQQESAYIDIIADAAPLVKKVVDGKFGDAERKTWEAEMRKLLPTGSPGKQVTMNVNAAGKLLQVLSAVPEGQSETALRTIHNMIADPEVSAAQIRRSFMELTDKPGIDNKVVSFILLVAGRDDVLVMDRIQSRHLWDDGRFEGANIYDGFMKEGTTAAEGLQGIMRGPRGLFITEALEDGLRPNVAEAYRMVGREQDASLGRFHWETWVIDGEQVVDHSTLQAVAKGDVIGAGVTEGKPGTFSSGIRYMRGKAGAVVRYPLSDGSFVFLKPETQKQFEAFIRKPKSGIIPSGFKVGERKDIPWYERPEVNRDALDAAARQFADSNADGAVKASAAQP